MGNMPSAESLTKEAGPILCDAVKKEQAKNYTGAMKSYKKGIGMLALAMRMMPLESPNRARIMVPFTNYVKQVARLEFLVKTETDVDQYRIAANSTGHAYEKIFTRCCDENLTMVHIQDAYIMAHHQIQNFVRFCELVVPLSKNLLVITLMTKMEARKNQTDFDELGRSLESRGVTLLVEYSDTIHDREILFDNGWIVKSGRGLDYFKASTGKYVLGSFDMNQRPCHETTIDILKRKKSK